MLDITRFSSITLVAAIGLGMAGCGTVKEDRTMGGTAAGVAFGAAFGSAFGGLGAAPGAVIGGVAGATAGAFTEPERVNFGEPPWNLFERVETTEE